MSRTDPITATDEEITAALEDAVLPPLLAALAHVTGDLSLLRDDLRIDPMLIAEPQGGMTEEQQAAARQLAFDVLVTLPRRRVTVAVDAVRARPGADDGVRHGHRGDARVRPAPRGGALRHGRGPAGAGLDDRHELAPDLPYAVAIVGAGMSGLLAAYRLQQAGVDFVVIEKNPDVGGTWWENTYPGCRVDNPNHNYSYSFAQRHDWPMHYSTQDVLGRYFRDFAEEHGLLEHVRFGTEVESVTWSDDERTWTLRTRRPDGAVEDITVNAVISATGQLNRPHLPEIDGHGTPSRGRRSTRRAGPLASTSPGKRVAVIGTGASAAQFIPIIAEQVSELLVFQRTPPWFAPDARLPRRRRGRPAVAVPARAVLQRVEPLLDLLGDGRRPARPTSPPTLSGSRRTRSVSEMNDEIRKLFTAYLEEQFAGRPDLIEKVVPTYPPGSKRGLRDNGVWAGALTRDNVELDHDRDPGDHAERGRRRRRPRSTTST